MKLGQLEVGVDVTMRVLWCVLVLVMLWAWLPGVRELAKHLLSDAIYAYRVEKWGEQYARRPTWQREALRVRGRAPRRESPAETVPPAYLELEAGPDE